MAEEQVGGAVEQVGGAGQHVELPLEMWEAILEKLEESKDIMKMLTAFPQLYGRIMTNSYVWLLDQVLPFLLPWLKHDDMLLLRQVSQRWLRAVDNLNQNHPDIRPHDYGPEVARYKYGIPEGYPGYNPTEDQLLISGCEIFRSVEELDRFSKKMKDHPPKRNPFITRYVAFYPINTQGAGAELFWRRAEEFAHQFGRHIWYLYAGSDEEGAVIRLDQLRTLLYCVPHLKALVFADAVPEAPIPHCQPFSFNGHFPVMRELETLDFLFEPDNYLSNALIHSYSSQLKKLAINSKLWRPEYGNMLPQLTQLLIFNIEIEMADDDYQILPSLPALHLSTLQLVHISPSVLEYHVIPNLVRFPVLRNLLVRFPEPCIDDDDPVPQPVFLPSIKYFKVTEWTVYQLDVCLHFPKLECLWINSALCARTWERLTVNQIFRLEAWELLPKLKEIVYENWGGESKIRFRCTRAKYEYLKELARREPEDIFPAFDSMIAGNWGNQDGSI